ncbi:c-type cytochrome [Hymenobacter wooponensis]|uniref:C-type cytochrome n=1 Tax=Hymenobacter wooponensis TaxID=1525360 RepID=A0A4Z0MT44_9BACT|nr:c-type cytochrome [Hymenobacter wooponensis]TGD82417.1 c-type cytochrome [Hymenobacter wooponensis]
MKKAFLLLGVCASLASCGSGSDEQASAKKEEYTLAESDPLEKDSTTAANATAVAHQPQIDTSTNKIGTAPTGGAVATGAKLMEGADCASCHRVDEKLLGPAYKAVAAKYPATDANITMLANKVITGGKGNWGDIAMTPHPGLSVADAKEMTRYILSLK